MAKTLDNKVYANRTVSCSKCRKHLFDVRMDAQILVSPEGLVLFGYASYQCSCGRNGRFLSPVLPGVVPDVDNQYPDTKMLETRSAGVKRSVKVRDVELAKDLGYQPKQQNTQKEIQENSAAT